MIVRPAPAMRSGLRISVSVPPVRGTGDDVMRGSDKHGPRLDEQLKHDTNALVTGSPDEGRTERRLQEGLNDGEGTIGHRPDLDEAPGAGLSEGDLAERERVATAI